LTLALLRSDPPGAPKRGDTITPKQDSEAPDPAHRAAPAELRRACWHSAPMSNRGRKPVDP